MESLCTSNQATRQLVINKDGIAPDLRPRFASSSSIKEKNEKFYNAIRPI